VSFLSLSDLFILLTSPYSVYPMMKDRLSPKRDGRSRGKDYPAGNLSTSSSRIAFLRSLCNLDKFGYLVDLVELLVGLMFIS